MLDKLFARSTAFTMMKQALCLILGLISAKAFAETADAIYHGGAILTMAGKTPTYVEALAVKDGKTRTVVNAGGQKGYSGDGGPGRDADQAEDEQPKEG